MTDATGDGPGPERKRSLLLSPAGIGTVAILGTGAFAATNGFGLASRPCTELRAATSLTECQAVMGGPACAAAFGGGAQAVGLTRTGGGSWSHQPLRPRAGGGYETLAGSPFVAGTGCRGSSSSSRSFYWGGSSAGSSAARSSASSSTSASRGGFGSTSRSFFSGGG